MLIKYLSLSIVATVALCSFQSIDPALAGGGNTVNQTDVFDGMGSGGKPTTRTRNSKSAIENPTGANVHNDIQIGVNDSCKKSKNTNNTSHSGSVGASVSANVDVCNPIYNLPATRKR
ncbi:hypothetical protein [Chamaesiphon sp. VAR_48_metabat_135_sub]|uniref:hypothetical protein n=1 Tax=Chamaesiphon sp. VAR_48_metabat_135_sub TaxID=2964699 RepID=UPI00286BB336|nr:hypothetical protein [Chamaesiphon sp. VAR_48_metabat_135_sub]